MGYVNPKTVVVSLSFPQELHTVLGPPYCISREYGASGMFFRYFVKFVFCLTVHPIKYQMFAGRLLKG